MHMPVYEIPPLDVVPLGMDEDYGDISVDLREACSVLDTCVSDQTQTLCDLVCDFQFGQVPATLPNIEHIWDDDLMSSVELSESFSEFILGGFDAEVATMVAEMERNIAYECSAEPPDDSSEPDDLKDELYVPTRTKRRPCIRVDGGHAIRTFLRSVHVVVAKFGVPMTMRDLGKLWKGPESLDAFLVKKRRYFRVKGTSYTLSKRGRRKMGVYS
jgi:hypothetical protein